MSVLEFRGAAASFVAGNTISTNENFLTIENGAGSGRTVLVNVVWMAQTQSQTYSTPMHLRKTATMPTGGNVVTKQQLGGGGSSAAAVVVRASRIAENGAITAIVTTGESEVWRTWPPRWSGASLSVFSGYVPGSPQDQFLELLEGEALILEHHFSTSPGTITNSNTRESGMIYWEEYSPDVATAKAPPFLSRVHPSRNVLLRR